MHKERLILVGGGGHCRSCIDVIEASKSFKIVGILDPDIKPDELVLGYPVVGGDDDVPVLAKEGNIFLVTIGHVRHVEARVKAFLNICSASGRLASVISPYAYVSPYATMGQGTIVMHGALVNAGAKIGNNCIINSQALIEHDSVIADHVHVSTGARINGGVAIGTKSFIGSGAVVVEGANVPAESFVKANSIFKE